MSDTPKVPVMTDEEKVAHAKELYGRGSRNYLVKDYTEAADDLSQVCALYAEIYGDNCDEVGMPYLLYAKSLIALAQQGENKVLDVPEEEEPGEDDDDDDDDDGDDDENDVADGASAENVNVAGTSSTSNGANGTHANGGESGSSSSARPQPGVSGENAPPTADDTDAPTEDDEDSQTTNLQIAWEVLELAVKIFLRQGDSAASNLADAYLELGEISLENVQYDAALRDYKNSLDIRMKLPDDNLRVICEIEYKIGLVHMMLNVYEESIAAFKRACAVLDAEIATEKSKNENVERTDAVVKELEELKTDILNKIIDVEEAKQQSTEEVKLELAKLMVNQARDGAGSSSSGGASASVFSSSSASATVAASDAKPMDISHLIKRKKPDAPASETAEQCSPAKRPAT